ncbi:MAG: GtrA family protein [Microbacteriaceae bacterium]|jgi:putative flippase GtrA|nr:GtrA family protein [Microbacteriaceae bacterium]
MRAVIAQFGRFGLVGLVGLAIDVGVFNLLRLTVLSPEAMHEGPVIAKIISTSLAIVANWLGNRYWTFGKVRRPHWILEAAEFALVSIGGMLIALGCLWISHYALGYTSAFADNVSTNVVGLVLGTAFRFTFYRLWVFGEHRPRATRRPPVGVPHHVGERAPAHDGAAREAARSL